MGIDFDVFLKAANFVFKFVVNAGFSYRKVWNCFTDNIAFFKFNPAEKNKTKRILSWIPPLAFSPFSIPSLSFFNITSSVPKKGGFVDFFGFVYAENALIYSTSIFWEMASSYFM